MKNIIEVKNLTKKIINWKIKLDKIDKNSFISNFICYNYQEVLDDYGHNRS